MTPIVDAAFAADAETPRPLLDQGFDPRTASFVRRSGSSLTLDGNEFRFVSFNIPNYHVVEDPPPCGGPAWHRVTAFEQDDAARTVRFMGGRCFRVYVPSVEGGRNNGSGPSHVYRATDGTIAYDEALWSDMDRGLAIAASQGLRVIIPLVDNWRWFGGPEDWAVLTGARDFWSDDSARKAFKSFLEWLLERRNTVTGLLYREDPTILCWELGNEIDSASDAWIIEMAAYLKSLDGEHLVMDGGHRALRRVALECPDIDIMTTHYADDSFADDAKIAAESGKAYIYGEFDPRSPKAVQTICERAFSSKATGIMAWSLRFRAEGGGYYHHEDFRDSDSLQYPGFDPGRPPGEAEIFSIMRSWAWRFRGYALPALE